MLNAVARFDAPSSSSSSSSRPASSAAISATGSRHELGGDFFSCDAARIGGDGRGNSGLKCFRVSYFGVLRRPGELDRSESSEAWPPRSPFAKNCSRKFSLPRSMAQLVELC